MNTFVSSFAILAGLIATSSLLHGQAAVATTTSSVSRLGQMVLDPVPDPSEAINNAAPNSSGSRLGGMLLAQIPQQPTVRPGQNPNTLPPGPGNRPGFGGPSGRSMPPGPNGLGGRQLPSATAGSPTPPPRPPATLNVPQPAPVMQTPVEAPQPVDGGTGDGEMVEVVFQGVPLPQILLKYEEWTGKKVIRDINVEAVNFTIDTTGALPKKKAIDFVERSLLLNGYGFLPAGEDFVKFINLAAIKPGAEHPFVMKEEELPQYGEAIVTYIEPLKYLEPDDLKKTLSELVQLHAYGVVTALPNARGVAITENSNTIRYIVELLKTLDVAPTHTEKRSFQLQRASAEDVAKALADILDLESKGSSGSGSGGGSRKGSSGNTAPVANPVPGQPPGSPQANAAARTGVYGSAPQASAPPPKIIPIARTNKLLVIARESDLDYIATLIDDLDGATEIHTFITRSLKYLSATDILPIIKDAITRGVDDSGGAGGSSGGSIIGKNNSNNKTGDFGRNNSSSGSNGLGGNNNSFGSNSGGFGGAGGTGGGMGSGASGLQGLRQGGTTPQSLVVGKTLLIADPVANEIFASGAPEHLRVLQELLDELDKRPRSVMLSVVIGQLKLDDNKDFGIDYYFRPNQLKAGGFNANVAGTAQNRVGSNTGILDPNAVSSLADLTKVAGNGIQLFGTIQDQVTVAISALAGNTNFKVLSRPTLYTMNNQPASIETGLKIPVPVSSLSSLNTTATNLGTSNGFVSNIQYQDVQLRLDVSPLINSDDELTLQVKQVNADVAGSTSLNGNNIPNISNQGLETTIMVKNNATVLLGGLIQETKDKQRSGIPILKDLPLIKYLASSTKDNLTRNELLVFIQPRIITGDGDQPVSSADSAGASPLGDDARKFMNQERSNPDPEKDRVHRSKVSSLLHKLFE